MKALGQKPCGFILYSEAERIESNHIIYCRLISAIASFCQGRLQKLQAGHSCSHQKKIYRNRRSIITSRYLGSIADLGLRYDLMRNFS